MILPTILKPTAIAVGVPGASQKLLFERAGSMLAPDAGVPAEIIAAALMEREQKGPTMAGNGVAIPHAEVPGLKTPLAALLCLHTPVEWHAFDSLPVDILMVLIGPEDEGAAHLKRLAEVSRMLRNSEIRAKIRGSKHAATIHALLVGMAETA